MKRTIYAFLALLLLAGAAAGASEPAYAQQVLPIAENLEVNTYRNTSVGGRLSAHDPQGGELEYIITTQPVKGDIELKEDGSFVYTPREGKKGRDYFGYKVRNSAGELSQEATVIIRIQKQLSDVSYSDMKGRADEYSAILLSERNIFTGEKLGGKYCFSPEKHVSRGEFLSVCMLVSQKPVPQAVLKTSYFDDASIPEWMKAYAAAAAMGGVYQGQQSDEGTVFAHDEALTKTEAALIMDRIMNITEVSYYQLDPQSPEELAQACVNLAACGVLDNSGISPDYLTRADMASMAAAALAIMDNR